MGCGVLALWLFSLLTSTACYRLMQNKFTEQYTPPIIMSHHPLRRLASAAALPSLRARVALVAGSQGIITLPAQSAGTELEITATGRNATGESAPAAALTALLP